MTASFERRENHGRVSFVVFSLDVEGTLVRSKGAVQSPSAIRTAMPDGQISGLTSETIAAVAERRDAVPLFGPFVGREDGSRE
jgi:hypothetical protein